jgi:hypothetical protein
MKDNKLIAEFMGIEYVNVDAYQLPYNKDWNWLMPVVESCFERLDARDTSADEIKRQLLVCNLKGVHTAVIEFIKTYN